MKPLFSNLIMTTLIEFCYILVILTRYDIVLQYTVNFLATNEAAQSLITKLYHTSLPAGICTCCKEYVYDELM